MIFLFIISGQETFAAVQSMAEDMIDFYQLDQSQTEAAVTTEGVNESTVPSGEPAAPPSESIEPSSETPRLFQRP